jgi:RNA polymerase sigma-70 factor, ECF subfamily
MDPRLKELEFFYSRNSDKVFSLVMKIVKDKPQAEDIIQDSYVKALKHINSYTAGTSMKNWFSKICKNQAINSLRKTKFRSSIVISLGFVDSSYSDLEANVKPEQDKIIGEDLQQKTISCLREYIYPGIVDVLVSQMEDRSYSDTAKDLEIKTGTVMSRLYRARKKSKEILKKHEPEIYDLLTDL